MTFDHLWAGWRASYVTSVSEPAVGNGESGAPGVAAAIVGTGECVFCTIVSSSHADDHTYIVSATDLTIVVLNAYPYASGHLMVMPKRHARDLEDLTPAESSDLWEMLRRSVATLKLAYSPDGLNIGINLGRAAGAGIPEHMHVHAVPRWIGDTNFMTATASVRVLPEALGDSWKRLRDAWQ